MKQMINKNTILKVLFISVICVLAFRLFNQEQQNEIIRKGLIKQVSKKLYQKEVETRKTIFKIEQRIQTIENKDRETQKQIETTDKNYKTIIRNLKKIDNDKTKTDMEIIIASDSSDWNWFNRRFPKSKNNYGFSIETDTLIRKQSQNGQHKSN